MGTGANRRRGSGCGVRTAPDPVSSRLFSSRQKEQKKLGLVRTLVLLAGAKSSDYRRSRPVGSQLKEERDRNRRSLV